MHSLKTGLTLGFLAFTLTAAHAADKAQAPIPSPPVTPSFPPAMEWTGIYIGVNGGYGWSDAIQVSISDPRVDTVYQRSSAMPGGFVGGGQIGYNWQTGYWLFGFEADLQYADLGGAVAWNGYEDLGFKTGSSQYFGTVRARLGYAMDRTLVYLTGGLAYGGLVDQSLTGKSTSNQGFALGGGFEYAFTEHWTGRFEGLYVNLETKAREASLTTPQGIYTLTARSGDGAGLVRMGVNYKF